MNLQEITFKPIAHVAFTRAEINLMIKCSYKHYDAVCRNAGCPAEHHAGDGFLYKMAMRELNVSACHHQLTFDKLDILAKILEVGQYLHDAFESTQARDLYVAIRKVLARLNETLPSPVT